MAKINDRFEFDEYLNLDKYIDKNELTSEKNECNKFVLRAVIVHKGEIETGH